MLSEEYSKAIKEMPEVLEQLAELDGVLHDKKKALSDKGKHTIDTDRAILLLTYFSSENLAKHSENLVKHSENLVKESGKLTWLTRALFVLAFVQILLFIVYR